MKKIFLISVLTSILNFSGLSVKADIIAPTPNIVPAHYLMDYPEYRKIKPDNIKSLKILRYTEAGITERNIEEKAEILELYNYLKKIRLLRETKYGCTDNTTIFAFELNNGSKAYIEIECEWIVMKDKHYYFDTSSENKLRKVK